MKKLRRHAFACLSARVSARVSARFSVRSPACLSAPPSALLSALLSATILALLVVLMTVAVPRAHAADAPPERLQVSDPYVELHTGPGRGYPVFFVAERKAWIEVLLRHTDWFKVRTEGGKEGWVPRAQLESTLTASGERRAFRDVLVDDYLKRRLELGAAWGRFESEPMLKVFGAYRLSDALSLEGTVGQVQGLYSGTDFWHLNLLAQPWSDRRLSPSFGIGFGRFRNFPNLSLVDAQTTDANLANASIGLRYHLGERFVLRADYTLYTAFVADTRTGEYSAFTAGLSFFF